MIAFLLAACLQSASPTPSTTATPEEAQALFEKIEEKYVAQVAIRGTCSIKAKPGKSDDTFTGDGRFDFDMRFFADKVTFDLDGTLGKTRYHYGFEDKENTLGEHVETPLLFPVVHRGMLIGSKPEETEKKARELKTAYVRMGFMPAMIAFPERKMWPVTEVPEPQDLVFAAEKGAKANVKVLTWKIADSGEGEDKRIGATHKMWVTSGTLVIQKHEIAFAGGLTVTETWDPPKTVKVK